MVDTITDNAFRFSSIFSKHQSSHPTLYIIGYQTFYSYLIMQAPALAGGKGGKAVIGGGKGGKGAKVP